MKVTTEFPKKFEPEIATQGNDKPNPLHSSAA